MEVGLSTAVRASLATTLKTSIAAGTSGATLSLFQNNITPTPFVALTDFVEADFVGYARKTALTGWHTWNDAPTQDQIIGSDIVSLFAAASILAPQTVYGWYLTNAARDSLYGWGVFDVGYEFAASGDSLEVVPALKLLANTGQGTT